MENEKLAYLVWSAKDKINHIAECKAGTMEETHAALQELRAWLEARSAQTAPHYVPGTALPYAPVAPPVAPEIDPALAALI